MTEMNDTTQEDTLEDLTRWMESRSLLPCVERKPGFTMVTADLPDRGKVACLVIWPSKQEAPAPDYFVPSQPAPASC